MVALFYLLAIIAAEVVTTFVSVQGGIIFHAALLAVLILHSSLAAKNPDHRLLLSLVLAPLIRISSLSMPLAQVPQIYWYLIISLPLFVGIFMVVRNLKFRPCEIGLTLGKLPLQLAIGLTGVGFGIAEYYILAPQPLIAEPSWERILPSALILLVCTGFLEELIFRGVLQRALEEALGWWGLLYVSLLFAFLHIGHLSVVDVGFVFSIALFWGWIVKKTGSLFGVSLSHGIANIFLYLIAPFVLA